MKLLKKSFASFTTQDYFFSRAWEPSLWNVTKKEESTPTPQSLQEGRSLSSIGAQLQVIKLPSIMKRGNWRWSISKYRWPIIPLPHILIILPNVFSVELNLDCIESLRYCNVLEQSLSYLFNVIQGNFYFDILNRSAHIYTAKIKALECS